MHGETIWGTGGNAGPVGRLVTSACMYQNEVKVLTFCRLVGIKRFSENSQETESTLTPQPLRPSVRVVWVQGLWAG